MGGKSFLKLAVGVQGLVWCATHFLFHPMAAWGFRQAFSKALSFIGFVPVQ